jgi:UDP-N-acetylmuramoylalanine--D-glutamate ligase
LGAARLLHHLGHAVVVLESSTAEPIRQRAQELEAQGIEVRLGAALEGSSFTALGKPVERVIVSPGIRWDHPTLEQLRQQGVAVAGELAAAWEALAATPWIGITGTNGKTTVTHLVNHLLGCAGLDAPMGGNVGNSAAELALERLAPGQKPPDWLVVELSSYQIEACAAVAPRIGLWTTLTPDHLERHGTIANYRAIKRSLLERSACQILNADDPDLRSQAASWQRAHWVTAGHRSALPAGLDPLLWIEHDQVTSAAGPLLDARALAMPGAHNRQNLVLAAAVGLELGLSGATMEAAFRRFPGVPHRLERIGDHRGIAYYNDSKATNYDAAEVALQALPGPLVLVAGGQAKQGDASGWIEQIKGQAAAVVLFGAAGSLFQTLLQEGGYGGQVAVVADLEQAVGLASEWAAALNLAPDSQGCQAVLLSPACASFDQYSDFEARGDHFRQLVQALASGAFSQAPGPSVPA